MAETEFLTTRELAAMLRVKERKVHELAPDGALPVRRVTGKLLFPRAEIEESISRPRGLTHPGRNAVSPQVRPAVIAGGHDPLLEWAVRDFTLGHRRLSGGCARGVGARREGRLHRRRVAYPRARKCLECRGRQPSLRGQARRADRMGEAHTGVNVPV